MNRKLVSGLIAGAIVLAPAAAWAAHGRAGLWNISASMEMPNMPQMPPEAMAMMKARGMSMPGMGGAPIVTQICMTQDEVNADKPPQMKNNEENCTNKVLSQTSSSMSAETTCHGRMEGVGRMQMSWRGNEHYEGTYSFKGSMQGRPHEMTSHFTGDFVKADCGAVKPYTAKMAR
jgi:uncharacterized protein DUF3617